jgi:hypothetical protein
VHPLDSVRAKIRRGDLHLNSLERELTKFLTKRKRPPRIGAAAKVYPDEGYISVFVDFVEEVPLRIAVIAADAFHNFRSAIDQLIFETALIDGGGIEPKKSAFPASTCICNFRSDQVQKKMLADLTVRHRALVRRFQPYRGWKYEGAHPLTLLDDLSNDDKHRFTQPLSLYCETFPISIDRLGQDCVVRGFTFNPRILGYPLRPGDEIARILILPKGPNPKVNLHLESTVAVCIRNGEPVLPVGRKISRFVKEIVAAFEPEFERPKALRMRSLLRPGNLSSERGPMRVKMTIEGSDTPFD